MFCNVPRLRWHMSMGPSGSRSHRLRHRLSFWDMWPASEEIVKKCRIVYSVSSGEGCQLAASYKAQVHFGTRKYPPPLSQIWIDCLTFSPLRLHASGTKPVIQPLSTLGGRPLFLRAISLMPYPVSTTGGSHVDRELLLGSSSIVLLCLCINLFFR